MHSAVYLHCATAPSSAVHPTSRRFVLTRAAALFAGLAFAGAAFAADPPAETPATTAAAPAPAVTGPHVSIKTSMGEIVLELDQEKAPKTVANFIAYVKSGFYKGTIFHRVIDGFMIQAGGMDAKMGGKVTLKPVKNESNNGLHNEAYTVAMARENHPDSATSQFFINVVNNTGLDYPNMGGSGYTVFGKVIEGQDVVDKIKAVVVDDMRGQQNVPVVPIVIKSATVTKK